MAAHAELIDWAATLLGNYRFDSTVVAATPYSTVVRLNAGNGIYYLKQTPLDLFVEAAVLILLRDDCGVTAVPDPITVDRQLRCFLMPACGDVSLRRLCGGHVGVGTLDIALTVRFLNLYHEIQRATVSEIQAFIEADVPDWRLHKLPDLYLALVNDFLTLQSYGLTTDEIAALQALTAKVEDKCASLDLYGVAACLTHSDLHDDNMLFDTATRAITIVDHGDVAISHPFFSLSACLARLIKYPVDLNSDAYQQLQDACFGGWGLAGEKLQSAIALANDLAPLYWVFSYIRLGRAVGKQALDEFDKTDDRVRNGLMVFLKQMTLGSSAISKEEFSGVF